VTIRLADVKVAGIDERATWCERRRELLAEKMLARRHRLTLT
jgi:hypothetical protein